MARKYEEIGIHLLHIDRQMRRRLCAVHKYQRAVTMGDVRKLTHGIDRAQHVRHMRGSHKPCARRKQLLEGEQL